MFNLFQSKPLLDDSSRQWLYDSFHWAMAHFDSQFFADKSQLVLPTAAFFPDRANNADQLASNVFDRVKTYTGLFDWPFQQVPPQYYQPQPLQLKGHPDIVRGENTDATVYQNMLVDPQQKMLVSYDPVQLNQPQVMIANYATMLANYLIGLSNQQPPGGEDYRAPSTEILAIFMGFGVMFANTAYAFRGGCGSCHNHAANRVAVLSENEAIYALALFCQLKEIDNKTVTPQLKKYLRPLYKQAVKDIKAQPEEFEGLKAVMPHSSSPSGLEHKANNEVKSKSEQENHQVSA